LRPITLLCTIVLLCNSVYERWLPVLNTQDLTDACYGFAGSALAFVFLFLVHRHGLRPNPHAEKAVEQP
jgi:hypothetical protein